MLSVWMIKQKQFSNLSVSEGLDAYIDVLTNEQLTQLLDFKQMHASSIEARFAREQAGLTARQGETIMIFTIVTIVFVCLSSKVGRNSC